MIPSTSPFYIEDEFSNKKSINSDFNTSGEFADVDSTNLSSSKLQFARSFFYSSYNSKDVDSIREEQKINKVFDVRSFIYDSVCHLDSSTSFQKENEGSPMCLSTEVSIFKPLLSEQCDVNRGKKTLILDLDETLIHSSFVPQEHFDFCLPVHMSNKVQPIFVTIRPGLCHFLRTMSKLYEIVVYTASVHSYADKILDYIDPSGWISHRLYRHHCIFHNNMLVKDLSLLGRNLSSVVIVDNSHLSFQFQPENGIECIPFVNNSLDCELSMLEPFLLYLSKKNDIRKYTCLWENTRQFQSIM